MNLSKSSARWKSTKDVKHLFHKKISSALILKVQFVSLMSKPGSTILRAIYRKNKSRL